MHDQPGRKAVHIVIMGCGRVGSTLAHILEDQGHSVAVIDQDAEAFRKLRRRFKGSRITGIGFDRDVLTEAGIERRRRLRRGQQRRQLQHHLRPGGPRVVRRRAGRGPHLRPPAGRGLPAAGHPHRGHRPLDRRPDAAPAAARGRRAAVARPDRHDRAGRGGLHRTLAGREGQARWRSPPGPRSPSSTRLGEADGPGPGTVLQEGDVLHVVAEEDDLDRIVEVLSAAARKGSR